MLPIAAVWLLSCRAGLRWVPCRGPLASVPVPHPRSHLHVLSRFLVQVLIISSLAGTSFSSPFSCPQQEPCPGPIIPSLSPSSVPSPSAHPSPCHLVLVPSPQPRPQQVPCPSPMSLVPAPISLHGASPTPQCPSASDDLHRGKVCGSFLGRGQQVPAWCPPPLAVQVVLGGISC